MWRKNSMSGLMVLAATLGLIAVSCGKVKDTANEITNEQRIKGHWLMSQSEHGGAIESALENESMVLTFKDGKTAFSPTDSVKGRAAHAALSRCNKVVRSYKTEDNQIVFLAEGDCPEKRVTVQQLDGQTLKFPDPDDGDVTRVFNKIDDNRYMALVKASDRRP